MDFKKNERSLKTLDLGWGEPTRTLVSWRQGFRHPTRNKCMGWFAQILELHPQMKHPNPIFGWMVIRSMLVFRYDTDGTILCPG